MTIKKIKTKLKALNKKYPKTCSVVLRTLALLLVAVPMTYGYMAFNLVQLFPPTKIPLILGEQHVPYIAWTSVVYLSVFNFVHTCFIVIPDRYFRSMLAGLVMVGIIQMLFWYIMPTAYELRPRWSEIKEISPVFGRIRDFTAYNAFPSQHVSMSFFGLIMLIMHHGKKLTNTKKSFFKIKDIYLMSFWFIALSISTLTVKQHYILDIFGGIALGLFVYLIVRYFINKKVL